MKSADLLLQTSFAEGLSTVLLEAIASELPFITTPAGGNGDFGKQEMGEVISFDDLDSLGQKILSSVDDQETLNKIKNNDKKYANNYSWLEIFPKIFQTYQSLSNN